MQAPEWRWGIAVSVALHALVVAALLVDFTLRQQPAPEEGQAIEVELVQAEPEEMPEPEPEEAPEPEPEEAPEPQPEEEPAPEQEEEPAPAPPEQPAEAAETQAASPSVKALRPVFEFGEEDAGPRISPEGNASEEAETPAEETPVGDEAEESDAPPAEPAPEAMTASDAEQSVPSATETEEPPVELTEATELYSQSATDDTFATTAMGSIPRATRAGELCSSELLEQLRHSPEAVMPQLIPSYRLPAGNILQVRKGAFFAGGAWYDVSFRCEIDPDATRVVSFAYDIGGRVPRSEWNERGFPSF